MDDTATAKPRQRRPKTGLVRILNISVDDVFPSPENCKLYRPVDPKDPAIIALAESKPRVALENIDEPHDSDGTTNTMRINELRTRDAAIAYANMGLAVFPVWKPLAGVCTCRRGSECFGRGKASPDTSRTTWGDDRRSWAQAVEVGDSEHRNSDRSRIRAGRY